MPGKSLYFFATFILFSMTTPYLPAASHPLRKPSNPSSLRQALTQSTENCPSSLNCYTMSLPLDHNEKLGKRINVAFAIHPAKQEAKGALLVVFGGPGDSGISGLAKWLPAMNKDLVDHFDLVTFDLRGSHRSGGLDCPNATYDFSFLPARAATTEDEAALVEGSAYFTEMCIQEMGVPPKDLAHYNTVQAIQDVNAFRRMMGYSEWTVHAMSYGTQFMQHYTSRYPKQIKTLVLDGAVDMKADMLTYARDVTDAKNSILNESFKRCEKDSNCASLFPEAKGQALDIGRTYDQTRSDLEVESAWIGTGDEAVNFSAFDFEYAASLSVGNPQLRLAFLKGMAMAVGPNSDYSLLLKLANSDVAALLGKPIQTAEEQAQSASSTGIFYAFICNDYDMPEKSPAARAQAFIKNARPYEAARARIRTSLYSEIPCAFWPKNSAVQGRLAPQVPRNKVLIVNATADAAVPAKHGRTIFAEAPQGAMVEVEGGKHIMYGYGFSCVDDPVTQFLLTGTLPKESFAGCKSDLFEKVGN